MGPSTCHSRAAKPSSTPVSSQPIQRDAAQRPARDAPRLQRGLAQQPPFELGEPGCISQRLIRRQPRHAGILGTKALEGAFQANGKEQYEGGFDDVTGAGIIGNHRDQASIPAGALPKPSCLNNSWKG